MTNALFARTFFLTVLTLCLLTSTTFGQTCPGGAGCLDPAFGSGGIAIVNVPGVPSSDPRKMAVQANGKLVVLTQGNVLFRLNPDGSTDTSFGNGGFVYSAWPTGLASSAKTLVIQADGRIVVGGTAPATRGVAMRFERYNSDGSLDSGSGTDSTPGDLFGTAGVKTIHNAGARALTVQTGGKILAIASDGSLVRLNVDGTPDATFGNSGIAGAKAAFSPSLNGLVVLPSGRIAAAGSITSGNVSQFAVLGFNSNGSPDDGSKSDTTKGDAFGSGGKLVVTFSGYSGGAARAMALDASGRLVAVGRAGQPAGEVGTAVGIARLTPTGQVDNTFGVNGRTIITIPDGNIFADAVGFQSDGRIVVMGGVYRSGDLDAAVYRFASNGVLDSFDGLPVVTTDAIGGNETGRDGVVRIDPGCGCEKISLMTSAYDRISVWTPVLIQYVP